MKDCEKAIRIAYDTVSKNKYDIRYRHVALLFEKGRLVAVGRNRRSSRARHIFGTRTLHAEMDALRRAGARRSNLVLFVCRVTPGGKLANSKPCPCCQAVLAKRGIQVYYTTSEGLVEKL